MAPENAPEWVFDRAILWNNVEAKEDTSTRRASAQPAREIRFAIAREIPMALAPPLVRQFVQKNFVNQGMIADVAIHNPNAKDGGKNPHFHVMLTTRHIDSNDPHGFGNKNRDWNEHTLQTQWRENWAATQNAYFEENKIEVRVSSKSNKERGIDRQSTNVPISAYKMEERNLRTNAGDQARETHEYNRLTQMAINAAQWVRGKSNHLMHKIREYYYGYNIGNTQKSAEQAQDKSKQKNQGLDR